MVLVSRSSARAGSAARWCEATRSHLHEQPYGEPSLDDGDFLPADEIALQNFNGRAGISFRHLRHQDSDRASWARSESGAHSCEPLILASPRKGEFIIRTKEIIDLIDKNAEQLAVVMFGGVNFFTGQLFDIEKITAAARKHSIIAGFDLAHAIGNVPLSLHDWNVDFAVWCSYKYLNAGPGAVAAAFIHERHASNTSLPRLAGWFGNDPNTRFRLHLEPDFIPVPSADGWQISNPPIFSIAPLRASLAMFDEAGGMEALRAKSVKLTGYLQFLLEQTSSKRFTIITPRETHARGCQLSILAHEDPKELFNNLQAADVKCDFREPNIIRAAPTPLYNTFHEVWHFAKILSEHR